VEALPRRSGLEFNAAPIARLLLHNCRHTFPFGLPL
jgi:hypothetical protein